MVNMPRHPLPAQLFCLIFASSWAAGALAAPPEPPTLSEGAEARLAQGHRDLTSALKRLKGHPKDKRALQQAERAIAAIELALRAYFHDPRLPEPDRRPIALATRPAVSRLLAPEGGLWVVAHDRLALASTARATLAQASKAQGQLEAAVDHYEALLAVEGPSSPLLVELMWLYEALGRSADLEAARLGLAALKIPEGQPTVDNPKPAP